MDVSITNNKKVVKFAIIFNNLKIYIKIMLIFILQLKDYTYSV